MDVNRILKKANEYYKKEIKALIISTEDEAFSDMFDEGGYAREQIVQWIQRGIESAVYGSYTDRMYKRRGFAKGSGGLGDPNNIVTQYNIKTRTVDYKDVAQGNPAFYPTDGLLEPIILSGVGYHYPETGTGYFAVPRNYYDELEEEWGNGDFIMDFVEPIVNTKLKKNKESIYIACLVKAYNEMKGVK